MSNDPHDDHDTPDIPVSAGMSSQVLVLIVLGVLIVFMQGGFVVGSSGWGHVWPAADSVKIPL